MAKTGQSLKWTYPPLKHLEHFGQCLSGSILLKVKITPI